MKIFTRRNLILVFWVAFFAVLCGVSFSWKAYADEDISNAQKSLKKTQEELERSQANLSVTQKQIYSTTNILTKTETEISRKEAELKDLKNRLELNRKILTAYMQEMYFNDREVSGTLISSGQKFSDYFHDFDQALNVENKVAEIIDEISADKKNIENVKSELAEKKEEHQEILADKQAEKNELVLTIAQLQAKMAKLRSVLSNFLGKSFSLDDVIEAVKYAEKKTGVRKEFLFAVLDKETDLGRFTGGCTYDKSKMGSTNLTYFKEICDDLGYNYKKMKVSCALSYGIGGAMGVAQFMPSTWMGYKDAIASKTGNDPADPWNLKDGIMGMALYLKNKGGDSKGGERTAAAAYYCGSRLERAVCQNYANTVISWSKSYDDYF